jgi:hypothetical protein
VQAGLGCGLCEGERHGVRPGAFDDARTVALHRLTKGLRMYATPTLGSGETRPFREGAAKFSPDQRDPAGSQISLVENILPLRPGRPQTVTNMGRDSSAEAAA